MRSGSCVVTNSLISAESFFARAISPLALKVTITRGSARGTLGDSAARGRVEKIEAIAGLAGLAEGLKVEEDGDDEEEAWRDSEEQDRWP